MKIFIAVTFILVTSPIFSQTMVIRSTAGVYTDILTSNIERIDFAPCGIIVYEGQTYHTIKIGNQCWFAENLNVGTRINGSADQTNNSTIEKYCYGDVESNCTTYGGLYQWAEAVQYQNGATNTTSPSPAFSGNVQGICPTGWHIPTNTEFQTLASSATVNNDGNTLKAIGQGTGSGVGTNTSGFSALLAGFRDASGTLIWLNIGEGFWSSTETSSINADYMDLYYGDSNIRFDYNYKIDGFSVRCLKD